MGRTTATLDTITLKGKTYVLVEEQEYRRLKARPELPKPLASGNYPALPAATATIAGTIVRRREEAGLTQKALALKAGIRPEVLNRIERGATLPAVTTLTKIENALNRSRRCE